MPTKCAHTFLMCLLARSYLTVIQSTTPIKLKNHVKGQVQNSDTGRPQCCKSPVTFVCLAHVAEGETGTLSLLNQARGSNRDNELGQVLFIL